MKKLAGIAAALACTALMSISAGAKSVSDYSLVYDAYNDYYIIKDPDTWETAGIKYSDGSISWYDGYGPDSEYQEEYEEYDDYENQYFLDRWYLDAPTITEISSERNNVELFCTLSADWDADIFIVERKTASQSSWEKLYEDYLYFSYDNAECWYTDTNTPASGNVSYRFSIYKYFDNKTTLVTSAEIDVYIESDGSYEDDNRYDDSTDNLDAYWEDTKNLSAPSIEVYSANENNVSMCCTLPYDWKPDGCTVERKAKSALSWENAEDIYLYSDDDFYECWYYDGNTSGENYYTYRFSFYKYFNGVKTVVTTAETEVYVKPDYEPPHLVNTVVRDTSAAFDISLDSRWNAGVCLVSRRTNESDKWVSAAKVNPRASEEDPAYSLYSITDSKLKQLTIYFYKFEIYSKDNILIDTLEISVETPKTPEAPVMLDPVAHQNSITITAVVDDLWKADGYEVLRYSYRKKKWEKLTEEKSLGYIDWKDDGYYRCATYTDTELKSSTKYNYMIRLYNEVNGKKKYFSKLKTSAYTLMPAPKLTVGATSTKATLNWSKVTGAAGYEVYVLPVDKSNDYYGWYYYGWYGGGEGYTTPSQYDKSLSYYNQSYNSSTLYSNPISDFTKKSTIKDGNTSASYNIKSSKAYMYIVRAYKKVGNTKVYGEFSNQETTDSTSALLNGIKLDPKVTVTSYDLELIKKALKKCVNNKMSNAEKAAAVYDYVHNAATYEYDYSKIPADPIEAILSAGRGQCYQYAVAYQAIMKYLGYDVKLVSGKTSSGGPHWWCELTCAGTTYMIDPQVGGRFLIRYDRMGAYTVTREKVYD